MKKKVYLLSISAICLAILLVVGGVYAGTEVKDKIEMKSPAYEHKKGIVVFTHKKHAEEYAKEAPEFFKNGCGECHHDDEGQPLTDLKPGDDVTQCIECHSKPGERPKGKDAPKLSKEEKLEYHAEALHDNCKGCHRKYDRAKKTKAAPTTCSKCHPRN